MIILDYQIKTFYCSYFMMTGDRLVITESLSQVTTVSMSRGGQTPS